MKLNIYMDKENVGAPTLAHYLGVSVATVFNWRKGLYAPSNKNINKIMEFTNGKVTAKDFYG